MMLDIQAPIEALKYAIKHVDQWMQPQRRAGCRKDPQSFFAV
jgi:hypothetical protein